ncbi:MULTISPECIES: hypothetical protein [Paenibacillus]|uniref:hypothetical protein n=1 Tax=Paenibacillus TaxID=44249 RepID=UPI0004136560|nr:MULTISPECIES: hypothetical protein [Paenibacillus]KGP78111.1 hypothetical protein P364_0130110 [Paenibacillus sp. MAEPY2]KGP89367.1 hypothetical protein P363_0101540 [Paenibacillus sp. MAEPY1]OZQ71082.1 hypothetical protein CA599_11145 [Paenibacillus taichungensis]
MKNVADYKGKLIVAIFNLTGDVLAKGRVIDTAGCNMIFVLQESGHEVSVTVHENTTIKVIA